MKKILLLICLQNYFHAADIINALRSIDCKQVMRNAAFGIGLFNARLVVMSRLNNYCQTALDNKKPSTGRQNIIKIFPFFVAFFATKANLSWLGSLVTDKPLPFDLLPLFYHNLINLIGTGLAFHSMKSFTNKSKKISNDINESLMEYRYFPVKVGDHKYYLDTAGLAKDPNQFYAFIANGGEIKVSKEKIKKIKNGKVEIENFDNDTEQVDGIDDNLSVKLFVDDHRGFFAKLKGIFSAQYCHPFIIALRETYKDHCAKMKIYNKHAMHIIISALVFANIVCPKFLFTGSSSAEVTNIFGSYEKFAILSKIFEFVFASPLLLFVFSGRILAMDPLHAQLLRFVYSKEIIANLREFHFKDVLTKPVLWLEEQCIALFEDAVDKR